MNIFLVKRPNSNSTESNVCLETDVCEEGTVCQVDDESETGFVCVKAEEQLITDDGFTKIVIKTDEPSAQSNNGNLQKIEECDLGSDLI